MNELIALVKQRDTLTTQLEQFHAATASITKTLGDDDPTAQMLQGTFGAILQAQLDYIEEQISQVQKKLESSMPQRANDSVPLPAIEPREEPQQPKESAD